MNMNLPLHGIRSDIVWMLPFLQVVRTWQGRRVSRKDHEVKGKRSSWLASDTYWQNTAMLSDMEQVQGLYKGNYKNIFMYFLHIYKFGLVVGFPKLYEIQTIMTIHTTMFKVQNSLSNHQKSYTSRCLRKMAVNPPGGLLCSQTFVKTEEIVCALGTSTKCKYSI